jgi:hypothetical protein
MLRKKKTPEEVAAQITEWRNEGLTDSQIMARHGGDHPLTEGYKWLEENPSSTPALASSSTKGKPARASGSGAPLIDVPMPA